MNEITQFRSRHWIEYTATLAVLVISVISLWVAIGTEDANRRMVEASSWPFLQVEKNNLNGQYHQAIVYAVTNAGVGPAKIEGFELFWKGKQYTDALTYIHDCCGLDIKAYRARRGAPGGSLIITGQVVNSVLRAGETRQLLTMPLGSDNAAVWHALDNARNETSFQTCYCSVFDECWGSNLVGDLSPKRVDKCPVPTSSFP